MMTRESVSTHFKRCESYPSLFKKMGTVGTRSLDSFLFQVRGNVGRGSHRHVVNVNNW